MSRRLYRNRENGIFLGVCAGLADFFEVQTWVVRLATVLFALLVTFWPVVLVYVTMGILLRDTPLRYRGRRGERRFWRSGSGESWQ